MSGMAGILRLDGAPVDPALFHKMVQALWYRGKDGTKVWHDGPIGFVHVHFWTTPEEVGEEQPIWAEDGRLWITADARVDNRAELIPLLQRYLNKEVPSDVEIILAAYQRWGEECARYLVGDFSFAIWDAVARKLFLARDVIGIRQLYYATVDGAFYFANTIGAILAALPRKPALNRPLIHEFLRGSYRRWICQTVYTEVLRLPPAHHLVVEKQVPKPQLYYVLGSRAVPHYTSDEEWLQAFRELFREAVRCRLRSITPIGISVSGGLDSSSVACMAHEIARQERPVPEIRLYSLVYRETPSADESEFLDAVAAHCAGFVTTRIMGDEFWALSEFGDDGGFPLDEPEIYPLRSQTLAILRSIAADNSRVALLGDGGDHVLVRSLYLYPQALHGLDWRNWLAEARYFRMRRQLSWLSLLVRAYLGPLIPTYIIQWLEVLQLWMNGRKPWFRGLTVKPDSRCFSSRDIFHESNALTTSAKILVRSMRAPREIARLSALDLTATSVGVELRFPFWDRRLIELLVGVPQNLIVWRGVDRVILRESLRDILPEVLRGRRSKSHFEQLVVRGLVRERQRIEQLLAASLAERMEFLRVRPLQDAFQRYWQHGIGDYQHLLRPLYVESWLRCRWYLDVRGG